MTDQQPEATSAPSAPTQADRWRPIDWDRAVGFVLAEIHGNPLHREVLFQDMITDPHGPNGPGVTSTRNTITVLADYVATLLDLLQSADNETTAVRLWRQALDAELGESAPEDPHAPNTDTTH